MDSTTDAGDATDSSAAEAGPQDGGSAVACGPAFARPGSSGGFQPTPAEPTFHAVVSEVGVDHLTLRRDGGDFVSFEWRGPSLVDAFSVGEDVSCQRLNSWSIVKNARRTAEISWAYTNTGLVSGGTIPGGATYTIAPQCSRGFTVSCGGGGTVTTDYFQIVVSLGAVSVAIPMDTTAIVGPWRVTNVFHDHGSFQTAPAGCIVDFINLDITSALGPP